jgi:hypothetical protein
MGFLGPPCKDLSRPLHVDCSVEYDLGNQPRIPKNSAPLLIIHPAYQQHHLQQQQQQHRYHPYSSIVDFSTDSGPTSHYDVSVTPASRLPSCRFTTGYHNNQTAHIYAQQQQQQQQQQPKFEFEVTQSAPPKPQHRITRHSSFLVGGGVSSRQVGRRVKTFFFCLTDAATKARPWKPFFKACLKFTSKPGVAQSQHFFFFVTYELDQQVSVYH